MASCKLRFVAAIKRTSHANRLVGSDPLEFAFLQHAQQFGLQVRIQFPDLVQKQGPAVGQLKAADLVRQGARKGALDMAEQLALDQAGG
jgi:hypothetical protein